MAFRVHGSTLSLFVADCAAQFLYESWLAMALRLFCNQDSRQALDMHEHYNRRALQRHFDLALWLAYQRSVLHSVMHSVLKSSGYVTASGVTLEPKR